MSARSVEVKLKIHLFGKINKPLREPYMREAPMWLTTSRKCRVLQRQLTHQIGEVLTDRLDQLRYITERPP